MSRPPNSKAVDEINRPGILNAERVWVRLEHEAQLLRGAKIRDTLKERHVGLQAGARAAIAVVLGPGVVADDHAEVELRGPVDRGSEVGHRLLHIAVRIHIHPTVKPVEAQPDLSGEFDKAPACLGGDKFLVERRP